MLELEGQLPENHKGLVVLFTGNGKGKTCAAMGIMTRSFGHGLRVSVIQFIKSPDRVYGEAESANRMKIPFLSLGDGFVFNRVNSQGAHDLAHAAWKEAQKQIGSRDYDVIILDEFTYLFKYGWLEVSETVDWLKSHRPSGMHLVMTGRYAPPQLIDYADLVTEMREIKHPYREQKIPAQRGVDY